LIVAIVIVFEVVGVVVAVTVGDTVTDDEVVELGLPFKVKLAGLTFDPL
jgi:hypothetical protein